MTVPSGERYRRIVDRSPDGILVIREARVAFANPSAVQMLGASSVDDLVGKSAVELFDPASTTCIANAIRSVTAGQKTSTVEAQITTLAGSPSDVEVTAVLLDIDEQEVQLTVRDISERRRAEALLRESEERLTLAFEGAQEGVWDWNLETGAVVYSPRWKRMLGYAEHEIEPNLSAWERILHPDDMSRARHVHDAVLRGAPTYEGNSGCGTGRDTTSTCFPGVFRFAARTVAWYGSSGRTSTSPRAARPKPNARTRSSSPGSCSRRKTSGDGSHGKCTISSANN